MIAASSAAAQTRPLRTEEATAGGAGRLVLETGVEMMAAEPNFVTRAARPRVDGPILRLVYSPASNVEMDIEWVALTYTPRDPYFGSVSDFGDVTLRSKLVLRDGRRTSWAGRFMVSLPQTKYGKGLGPDTLRVSAQALATRTFDRFRLHVNAGLAILDEVHTMHHQRDLLEYGVAAEWRQGERVALVLEVAGLAGDGQPGADARSEVRGGARLSGRKVSGDVALRRGLASATGTWGAAGGLTVFLRHPR
jgi:hypothetical protein